MTTTVKYYAWKSLVSLQDYSPFGAPLAGRTFKAEEAQYQLVNDNFTDAITGWVANISSGYTMVIDDGRLKFDAGIPWAGIIKTFSTVPGKKYHISVKVDMGTTQALYLIVRNVGNVNNTVVAATTNGAYEIDFTAVDATTTFHLEGLNGSSTATRTFYIDDVLIQEATSKTYRFGFNGQEKDDELKGDGNSYDFGDRMQDSRLGRWLSLDPLQAKYPHLSPYHYANNNPIYFIDIEGKYFTGSTKELLEIYQAVCKKAEAGDIKAIAIKAKLEALDKSEVEYHISTTTDNGTEGGQTYYDVMNNRINVDVGSDLLYSDNNGDGSYGDNYYGRLEHELEHAYQFENGDLGFKPEKPKDLYFTLGVAHDQTDEDNAVDAGTYINNIFFKAGINANKEITKPKSQEQVDAQKKTYDDLPVDPEKIDKIQVEHLMKEGKDGGTKNKYNYKPTEKQKAAKASVLTK